ncbi:hypothetical protein AB4543_17305 [Vibrio splendidus]
MEITREEWIKVLPMIVAALIAVSGWVITYIHKWYFDKKSNQLDRVNRQLKELYGPLYVRLIASQETWDAFIKKHKPAHGKKNYFGTNLEVTDREKEVWRNWMTNVFEPINAKTEEVILNNIDLLDSNEIPEAFVKALAHISAYKAVLADWEKGKFETHVSVNNWPSQELLLVVKPEYEKLKAKQNMLLNK